MKRLSILLLSLLPFLGHSQDLEINGLYFNILDTDTPQLEVVQGLNYSGIILLPETITYKGVTYTVTSIGDNAFFNCSALQYIEFSSSITNIGDNAFYGCKSLEEIYLPNNLSHLGNGAFRECSALSSIIIGSSLSEIPEWAFSFCENLYEIKLPDGIKSVGGQAFYGCSSLNRVTFGNRLQSIAANAFGACLTLSLIESYAKNPPAAVYLSFDNATYQNAVLKVPYYSDGLYRETSPWSNFNNIQGISDKPAENFIINGIQYQIIDGEESLSVAVVKNAESEYSGNIIIPRTINYLSETYKVTTITSDAFQNNYGIKSIEMGDNIISIEDYAFSGCDGLTSIKLSSSLSELPVGCFQSCLSLTSFTIPDNIKSIGAKCFLGCYNIDSLTLGSSLTQIGQEAFIGCPEISSVTSMADFPPTTPHNAFMSSIYSKCKLWVKLASLETYRSISPWNEFYEISEYDFTPIKSLSFLSDEYSIFEGNSFSPFLSVTPSYYTKSDLAWGSANSDIAIVDENGKVTGIHAGLTFIGAYSVTNPEIMAEFMLIVKENANGISTFREAGYSVAIYNGQIFLSNKPEELKCQVYNISGTLLLETYETIISGISHGIYILRIGNSSHKIVL